MSASNDPVWRESGVETMKNPSPSPLPGTGRSGVDERSKLLVGLGVIIGVSFVTLAMLRVFGLICPFSVPSSAMAPTVSPGDHVLMEGFTFLVRKPCRGDVAVFKT